MNCKKCGKELNPEDLFCSKCGTPVEKQEEPEQDIEETITEETVTEEEIEESVESQEENTKPKVEKKFDINKFSWDLDGFPVEEKNTEVEINWEPVMEQSGYIEPQDYEPLVKETVEEEEITEEDEEREKEALKEKIKNVPSFDWGLGTTAAFDRQAILKAADEAPIIEHKATDYMEEETEEDSEVTVEDLNKNSAIKETEAKIERFYTFNQKNAEFQELLDKEYDKLRERLKEEAVAEEELNRKYTDIEEARTQWENSWDDETTEDPDKLDDMADKAQDNLMAVIEELNKAETLEDEEALEVAETDEEAEALEPVDEIEIPEPEEIEEIVETIEPIEPEEVEEIETAELEEAEEEPELVEATEPEEAEEEPVQVVDIQLPEAGEEIITEEEVEEEQEETEAEPENVSKSCGDIFHETDVEEPEKKPKKKGKIVLLDILIVILLIVVILGSIMVFAGDSFVGQKIRGGFDKVVEQVTGKKAIDSKDVAEDSKTALGKLIEKQSSRNKNILVIGEDPGLKFQDDRKYEPEEVNDAPAFVDSIWFTNDQDEAITYGDEVVGMVIKYYSDLVDKLKDGTDGVLSDVEEDSTLYKALESLEEKEKDFSVESLSIGEIRCAGSDFYVLVDVTTNGDGTALGKSGSYVVSIKAADKQAKIEGISSYEK